MKIFSKQKLVLKSKFSKFLCSAASYHWCQYRLLTPDIVVVLDFAYNTALETSKKPQIKFKNENQYSLYGKAFFSKIQFNLIQCMLHEESNPGEIAEI